MPIKVVAITGSLRTASVNAGLLRAAAALAPKHDMEFIIVSADLPLYNGDLEEAGAAGDAHACSLLACGLADDPVLTTHTFNRLTRARQSSARQTCRS